MLLPGDAPSASFGAALERTSVLAPLARRWDARRRVHAEFVADRRAVDRAFAPDLARALLSLAAAPQPADAPAFGVRPAKRSKRGSMRLPSNRPPLNRFPFATAQ